MRKRILVISRNAWNNNISMGNTTSNIFKGVVGLEFANIFCRAEIPDNDICDIYYRITESELIKRLYNRKNSIGVQGNYIKFRNNQSKDNNAATNTEKRLYDIFRNHRFHILLWSRELLWKISDWKNESLSIFINKFKPDIIFMEMYDSFYMYDILKYAKFISNAKVVLFTGDDIYSLRKFSLSPLYWVNRIILRNKVRHSIINSELCYCMSEKQLLEFRNEFGDKFKVLRKSINQLDIQPFDRGNNHKDKDDLIKFVYTGNIIDGRWGTLVKLAKAINQINSTGIKASLTIYSTNKLSKSMQSKMTFNDNIKFMGRISVDMVDKVQKEADVLVHVESFKIKSKLQTRYSFSTKIVDYFRNSKCILAIGWEGSNSIEYLKKNNAAIVITDTNDIKEIVNQMILSPEIIEEYSENARICGLKNHLRDNVQKELIHDLKNI